MSAGPRQPVIHVPHGGGPWPFVDLGGFVEGDMRPDWVADIAGIRNARREQVRSAGQYRAHIE
jgi:hypothetical protein